MPGPKTHQIFYKELKSKLTTETLDRYPDYDKFSLFAQGHDLILFSDFYKFWQLKENQRDSLLLQEGKLTQFVYNYLQHAIKTESINNEITRSFIIGYISHHILDSYIHPQLIYYTGGHMPNKKEKKWEHGIAETLIDTYLMKNHEGLDSKKYKVYKDFKFEKIIDKGFSNTLTESLKTTYSSPLMGEKFKIAFQQAELLIRVLRYDPLKIKQIALSHADFLIMGASSLSYNVDTEKAIDYLNINHDQWHNPYNSNLTSCKSFADLYYDAIAHCADIINELDKLMKTGVFTEKDMYELIPDVSSITGLYHGDKSKTIYKK